MKNKVIFLILFLSLVLSYILGTILAKGLVKDKSISIDNFKINQQTDTSKNTSYKYIVIQGGLFKNKDNANKVFEKLKPYGAPFIIEENESYRVLLGFFTETKGEAIKGKMNKDNVANSKIVYEIKGDNLCDQEIGKVIDGLIQIEENLVSDNISAVKTDEFKKWVKELKQIDSSSKNYKSLNDLKSLVNNMGDKITKGELEKYNKSIYQVSGSFKSK
ncbi:MAG: SPOR domain-containing protein [Clostridiaceae bacterium]